MLIITTTLNANQTKTKLVSKIGFYAATPTPATYNRQNLCHQVCMREKRSDIGHHRIPKSQFNPRGTTQGQNLTTVQTKSRFKT